MRALSASVFRRQWRLDEERYGFALSGCSLCLSMERALAVAILDRLE